jgi:cobalt-zinc-cadmium efflux system outer membrane protein
VSAFRSLALGLAAAAAAALPAAAQQPSDTLDIARAIVLARTQNPRIAAASAGVAAAAARIAPAGAWPDPTVTFGAMNYLLPGLSPRGDPMTMNQVTVMQTLPINGALRLRRSAARSDSAGTALRRDALALDVEHEVRTRYWELYHTDRALETMGRTLGVLRDLVGIASAMYAVGSTSQADVLRAQLAVTRMQQEVADMELQRLTAAAALNGLLGRDPEARIVLRPGTAHEMHGGEVMALEMPVPPPVDSLVQWADAGNLELARLRAGVAAARASEDAARRMLLPDLTVGLSYGQRTGSPDLVSAMVGVSVPIFARSRQLRMRDETRAMRTMNEAEVAAMRLAIRAELVTARATAETARRQVTLYTGTLVPQAAAVFEASLAAYRVGRADFLTVLDAQLALLMHQHDSHRFEAMYGTAVADIDRLTGRLYVAPPPDRGME